MKTIPDRSTRRPEKQLVSGLGLLLALCIAGSLSAAELKRRVLVLPFDNVQHDRDFSWLSDSIAENLKNNLLKSNRFEVLDVTLLRKIDPAVDFRNLTAENATAFAKRLNCEVAVVGRFNIRKTGKETLLAIETDGVDALETKAVVAKRNEAHADAALFDVVEKLAAEISEELTQKLAPLDADNFKRDNKLEKLIRRLEKPPTGFLDELAIETLRFEPEFDIDMFEYAIRLNYRDADRYPKFRVSYQYWGKRFEPGMAGSKDLKCAADICTITGPNPVLELTKTAQDKTLVYRVRIELPDPRGPIIARWWVTAGYPYLTSASALGQASPTAIEPDSKLELGAMREWRISKQALFPAAGRSYPGTYAMQ